MKRRIPQAFTLIEMVTVVAVIVVLAGLVISISGYVQNKAAREKAQTQLKNYTLQCEAYKMDNGTYPQNEATDKLDPRKDFSPISGSSGTLYYEASRYLYSCLSGDYDPPNQPDYKPEEGTRIYYTPKRDELNYVKRADGQIGTVSFLQDPFGNCIGYSTAGNVAENTYREELKKDPGAKRPEGNKIKGYNPTFDLWSTGGATSGANSGKWIKNWGS
jgi:prepilin-type N-terminal cleavage/methylation domain-containing protein